MVEYSFAAQYMQCCMQHKTNGDIQLYMRLHCIIHRKGQVQVCVGAYYKQDQLVGD